MDAPDGWEPVDVVPKEHRPEIRLEPGQAIRRPAKSNGAAGAYKRAFKRSGKLDYHAAQRVVEGVKYIYIWRDPVAE